MKNPTKMKDQHNRLGTCSLENENNNRIPSVEDFIKGKEKEKSKLNDIRPNMKKKGHEAIDFTNIFHTRKNNYILFNNSSYKDETRRILRKEYSLYNYCILSVFISFICGLAIGVFLMGSAQEVINPSISLRQSESSKNNNSRLVSRTLNSLKIKKSENDLNSPSKINRFVSVTFTGEAHTYKKDIYPKGLSEDMKDILKDNKVVHHNHSIKTVNISKYVPNDQTVLYRNVYWGPKVEDAIPQGYGEDTAEIWEKYVSQSEVIKMEPGCGRMQNRLVTFNDGVQACVRYRQNTDQIQGEIFSFYVARLLNLTNLAPSVVKVVDLKDKLWVNVASDISAAQWNTNRAVVLTQYIPSLESATIPEIFKPSNRHLNKLDVWKMSSKENNTETKEILIEKLKAKNIKSTKVEIEKFDHIDMKLGKKTVDLFVELAQWSDLIIFDYLTANLDRIVNNLFNYQWNVNIMDGPAHNLARKMDSGLLLFLDNESGLLHGYRLLKKYNVYHSVMLDNLCVFRKTTVEALKTLFKMPSVGTKMNDVFHKKNNAVIRDILPPLPEKNAKILHERIGKVLTQVEKCEQNYTSR